MSKRSVLLLLAALALGPGAAHAADPRTVTVEVDPEPARLVSLYGIESAANAALAAYRGIDLHNGDDGVTVVVAAPAAVKRLDQAVRQRLEGRPGITLTEQHGVLLVALLTPQAWAKASSYERGKAVYLLEQLLPTARPRIAGLEIESAPGGAVVRTADSDLKAKLPKMIDQTFHQAAEVRPQGEGAWFVRVKDIPDMEGIGEAGGVGPSFARSPEAKARNAELVARMNREMAAAVDLMLREPVGLEAVSEPFNGDGPTRTRLFLDEAHIDRASIEAARTLIAQMGGILQEAPADQISINAKTVGTTPYEPLDTTLFNEVSDLINPPVDMVEQRDGVVVRAVDPARSREQAAVLRQAFADRHDLALTDRPDGSLLIGIAPGGPATSAPDADRITAAVRARLGSLKLKSVSLSPGGEGRVSATFSSAQDAAAFRENLRSGAEAFAMRLVDGDPYAPAADTPPTPGDLRKPLAEGGFVWLKPQALVTGAMLEPVAAVATDELRGDRPVVTFRFGPEGTRAFAALTGSHIGQSFAVMSAGAVIEVPVINDAITGGAGEVINLTEAQAVALAARMNAAQDDLPLKLVEQPGG